MAACRCLRSRSPRSSFAARLIASFCQHATLDAFSSFALGRVPKISSDAGCPLLALSGHPNTAVRTSAFGGIADIATKGVVSANDPKRTWHPWCQ